MNPFSSIRAAVLYPYISIGHCPYGSNPQDWSRHSTSGVNAQHQRHQTEQKTSTKVWENKKGIKEISLEPLGTYKSAWNQEDVYCDLRAKRHLRTCRPPDILRSKARGRLNVTLSTLKPKIKQWRASLVGWTLGQITGFSGMMVSIICWNHLLYKFEGDKRWLTAFGLLWKGSKPVYRPDLQNRAVGNEEKCNTNKKTRPKKGTRHTNITHNHTSVG